MFSWVSMSVKGIMYGPSYLKDALQFQDTDFATFIITMCRLGLAYHMNFCRQIKNQFMPKNNSNYEYTNPSANTKKNNNYIHPPRQCHTFPPSPSPFPGCTL